MTTRLVMCGFRLTVVGLLSLILMEAGSSLPVTADSLPVGASVQDKDNLSGPVATFSILGYDPDTGEVGGAVQSRVFTLTGVLTADADAGVVATQAIVDVSYGPQGIELLETKDWKGTPIIELEGVSVRRK